MNRLYKVHNGDIVIVNNDIYNAEEGRYLRDMGMASAVWACHRLKAYVLLDALSFIMSIFFSERMNVFNLHLFGGLESQWDRVYGNDGGLY